MRTTVTTASGATYEVQADLPLWKRVFLRLAETFGALHFLEQEVVDVLVPSEQGRMRQELEQSRRRMARLENGLEDGPMERVQRAVDNKEMEVGLDAIAGRLREIEKRVMELECGQVKLQEANDTFHRMLIQTLAETDNTDERDLDFMNADADSDALPPPVKRLFVEGFVGGLTGRDFTLLDEAAPEPAAEESDYADIFTTPTNPVPEPPVVENAFEIVSDPAKRAKYTRLGHVPATDTAKPPAEAASEPAAEGSDPEVTPPAP